MLIVPVIDLRAGLAVHAIAGERENYAPLDTALCPSADPLDALLAYRTLYPFPVVYIADLDAIERRGAHRGAIERLLEQCPDVSLWLDGGFAEPSQLPAWPWNERLRPVLGSESQRDLPALQALVDACPQAPLLSLDFKAGRFLGPQALWHTPAAWPRDIILMQLDRVGSGRGADRTLPAQATGEHRYFAAGGVRGPADLERLSAAGYAGVLVASALHDGRLSAAEVERAMRV